MKILALADETCPALWEYYSPGKLSQYDLILSCGDLKAEYLRFLVTMARCPLFYVHGNHDDNYAINPPEGCDCVEDKLVIYRGIRILGLGGSRRYNRGTHQYTQRQMRRRIRKLKPAIRMAGGVDILLTHAAPAGAGDAEDLAHRGFDVFLELIEQYRPKYMLHGHVHLNYGIDLPRTTEYAGTKIINCCQRYILEYENEGAAPCFSGWKRLFSRLFLPNLEILDI